jgi:hypothetical protein
MPLKEGVSNKTPPFKKGGALHESAPFFKRGLSFIFKNGRFHASAPFLKRGHFQV